MNNLLERGGSNYLASFANATSFIDVPLKVMLNILFTRLYSLKFASKCLANLNIREQMCYYSTAINFCTI